MRKSTKDLCMPFPPFGKIKGSKDSFQVKIYLTSGYKVNVKAIPIFHSIFFPLYEGMKDYCRKRNLSKWQEYLFSSVVAGSFCNIVTNPIWVIRTRVMAQALHPEHRQYQNDHILKIMNSMVMQEGPSSLFKGVSASILGVSNAVIYFFIYENFKEKLVHNQNKVFNSYYVLLASVIAKSIASTITYPFIVARTIMQDHRTVGNQDLIKMSDVFRDVVNKHGMKGFYAGLGPDLLRLIPSNTIVFLVYEFMKRKIKINKFNWKLNDILLTTFYC